MKKQLPVCAARSCKRKVKSMRSKLCRFHIKAANIRGGKKSRGNPKGNPGNAGNTSTGQVKIKAGKRSGLRRRAKNMQTMKAMAVSMKKTTKTMQATKTARRANSYAEGVAKLPRTMMKAMKAMKSMKRVPARARRELDE